jgi:hypothetical protein
LKQWNAGGFDKFHSNVVAYFVFGSDKKYSFVPCSTAFSSFVNNSNTIYKNNTVAIKLINDPNDAM